MSAMLPFIETILTKEELIEACKKGFEYYSADKVTKNDFCMYFGFTHGEAITKFYPSGYGQLLIDGGFKSGSEAYFNAGVNAWKNLKNGIYAFPPINKGDEICASETIKIFNTVLYGPPGTGKTFEMQRIFAQYGEDSRSMVTFHQSYSYEEFIVGLTAKTDEEGKVIYEYKKGVFYNACETAAKLAGYTDLADCCQDTKESRETRFAEIASDPSKQFLFCIDEINRANISSVFGDLISLIEEDKRLGTKNEMIVKLPYNQALFGVPANLHLLGTMNTADRSIQILDTALRRRFHFRELMPNYDVIKNETARNILTAINCRVRALLNKDRQIGHSYFFSIPEESSDAEIQILEAIRHKIIPLLQEYFYNEIGKIRFVMGEKGEPSSETDFFIYDEEANSSYRDYDADNEDVLFYKLNLKMLDEASVDNTKAKTILNHITQ